MWLKNDIDESEKYNLYNAIVVSLRVKEWWDLNDDMYVLYFDIDITRQ